MNPPNRTRAIFAIAATLTAAAAIVAARAPSPTTPDVTPCQLTAPVATPKVQVGDTIQMTARLSHANLLRSDKPRVGSLLVDLSAVEDAPKVSAPLDLAIVIDRSGSMSADGKLDSARRAAMALIDELRPSDRVALVTYSTNAHTDFHLSPATPGSLRALKGAVRRIEADGGTNISAALQQARDLLQRHTDAARVRRVILLSDGHATAGFTQTDHLARIATEARDEGVSVTAIGLGVEFNESLMTRIAQSGNGNYYYVSRGADLRRTFSQEFKTLTATVARDVQLAIRLRPGVTLTQLSGYAHTTRADGALVVPLGEFWAADSRSLMLDLTFAPNLGADADLASIADITLEYRDLLRGAPQTWGGSLSMGVTESPQVVYASLNPEVELRAVQLRTAATYQRAMDDYERGDTRRAQKLLRDRSHELRRLNHDTPTKLLEVEIERTERLLNDLRRHSPSSIGGKDTLKSTRSHSYHLLRRR